MTLLRMPWPNIKGEWTKRRNTAAAPHTGIDKSSPDQEHINERDSPEHGVPKAQPEFIVGKQAELDGQGDDPELQRGFFEERLRPIARVTGKRRLRARLRRQPLIGLEDAVDRIRVDRLVVVEIFRAQPDEEREAEEQYDDKRTEHRPGFLARARFPGEACPSLAGDRGVPAPHLFRHAGQPVAPEMGKRGKADPEQVDERRHGPDRDHELPKELESLIASDLLRSWRDRKQVLRVEWPGPATGRSPLNAQVVGGTTLRIVHGQPMQAGAGRNPRGRRMHAGRDASLEHELVVNPNRHEIVCGGVHVDRHVVGHIPDTGPPNLEEPPGKLGVAVQKGKVDARGGSLQ